MAREMDAPVLGRVPMEVPLMEAEDAGKSYLGLRPESHVSQAFVAIAEKIESGTPVSSDGGRS